MLFNSYEFLFLLLPLTLAFNLTLPASGRGFWWRFALGNACALHAIYRLLPDL